jgi:hypothetical protein
MSVLSIVVSILASFTLQADALYFYLEGTTPKCFFEQLPKDTLVVGHYRAEEFNPATSHFESNPQLGVLITVDETFDQNHRVVKNSGPSSGRFTFTAADNGDHKLCFTATSSAPNPGWLHSGHVPGGVKLHLDLAIGETSEIESKDKGKIEDIVQRVRDLNGRLHDIKREQLLNREREAEFRDISESTNAKVVRWTLIQVAVLGVTCAWQLSYLRNFFIKQKLT